MAKHDLEYSVIPPPNRLSFPKDVMLLLGTPVASHVHKNGETFDGDTGMRAQYLARELGVRVMAWQDIGPKVSPRDLWDARRKLTAPNFAEFAAESSANLAAVLRAHKVSRVIMRVHSGTGPIGSQLAIGLHQQKDIAVTHLAISDPVGLTKSSFLGGACKYLWYNQTIAKRTPKEHRNNPPTAPNLFSSFLTDVAIRGTTTWLTDVTYRNLLQIGNEQPGTAVRLHIPGNTFNGSPAKAEAFATNIQNQVHRPDNTFVVDYERDHHHSSSYDNLQRNVDFIRNTIALAPLE